MTDREKAISYLLQGHALLRAHGLYGRSEDEHFFALDYTLSALGRNYNHPAAAELSAAIQSLYEAKRLVTARASIEGRRIILGDWFLSNAVGLALPLRTPALMALIINELNAIGTNLGSLALKNSRKEFSFVIDRFIDAISENHDSDEGIPIASHSLSEASAWTFKRSELGLWRLQTPPESSALGSRSGVLEDKVREWNVTNSARAEQRCVAPTAP